jgi:hypothetical protein
MVKVRILEPRAYPPFKEEEKYIICDVCSREIKDGEPFIHIGFGMSINRGRFLRNEADEIFAVCGLECLFSNGAQLLFSAKVFPEEVGALTQRHHLLREWEVDKKFERP